MNCELQVAVCTYGADGIARVARAAHPRVEGVEYLVCWQTDGSDEIPPALAGRDDFRILRHDTRGISRNRNFALEHATAPVLIMGDDDVDYTADDLRAVMDCMKAYPEIVVATGRYTCEGKYVKPYPHSVTNPRHAPKGWYVSAIEIVCRPKELLRRGVRFNERISIGTPVLRCGEEDVFLTDALRKGVPTAIIPVRIGSHDAPGTGRRDRDEEYFIMTRGACLYHRYPKSWIPRALVRALRTPDPLRHLRLMLKGRSYARKNRIFKTPAPSSV